MKKVILSVISVAALALSTAGMAAPMNSMVASSDDMNNPAGFYITGNAGYGKADVKSFTLMGAPIGSVSRKSGFTWNAGAGYRFDKYLAVEAGYMQLPEIKGSSPAVGFLPKFSYQVHPSAVYLVAKGIYPVNEKFDLFAKGGAAYVVKSKVTVSAPGAGKVKLGETASSSHPIVPLVGLGADYYLNSNLAVTVQGLATIKAGGFPTTYQGTVGLTYKF